MFGLLVFLRFASQVYAVEYTDMAKHARTLVEKNGLSDVIDIIQGSVESIELPEKVLYHVLSILRG